MLSTLLRKIYFKIFKHYIIHERLTADYAEADRLIKSTCNEAEERRWVLDEAYEDTNRVFNTVFLCRKTRITE